MVNMRIHPLTVLPFILALIALLLAGYTTGTNLLLTAGLAAGTALIGIALILQRVMSPEAKQVPVENFSLWADVGDPGAELKRLSYDNIATAARVVATDLSSLVSNAELLGARMSLLINRPEFGELSKETLNRDANAVAYDIKAVVKKIRSAKGFTPELISSLEQYAARSDRIANRLYEFERGKSEVVRVYTEPLRRAAEKLARDLRKASANMSSFARGAEGTKAREEEGKKP